MDGRLKLIEQQLEGIDPAGFQNLCDIYLVNRVQEIVSISRTGSQFGKQKTVKGTPDTFFRLTDGLLQFVEFTTQATELVNKIKKDIEKCLDKSIIGVELNQNNKIIICHNSRLSVIEDTEIFNYASSKNINIELIGLDKLALEIYSKYLYIAKDILGIPLDTGQLLPIQKFVDEYDNRGGKLSTPLDNIFLNRNMELSEIERILANNDLLIISGFPGVGKTKIALEATNKFLSANKEYSAFVISNKDQDISEDLNILLQREKNYILLIDDANRQLPNFKQILGIFKEKREGNIKLIITVRDYVLNDIENECLDYTYNKITLSRFTDDEIIKLISSDSFQILNYTFQRKIVSLAEGNARIAIMASRLAQQIKHGFLYGEGESIFELYDLYFKTFIKDFNIFGKKTLMKTLGVISFFFTLDIGNQEFLNSILESFEVDYYEFNEAVSELEKRELVEVQYNHVRVSEQVMSTYFFYKVFIKDELLLFRTLLFNYFPKWENRFADTIIPSNNSFGYENVIKKINDSLDEYLNTYQNDEERSLIFFRLFWFYKQEETLNYFFNKINKLSEPNNPNYELEFQNETFKWEKGVYLEYLSKFFSYYSDNYISSLELSFEYSRKIPEALPLLVKYIKDKIKFNIEDESISFKRQSVLVDLLINNLSSNIVLYIKPFFEISASFLAHSYNITEGGRKNTITYYTYNLPFVEEIKHLRTKIWVNIFANFEQFPNDVLNIIENYRPGKDGIDNSWIDFDLSIICPKIIEKLDKQNLQHVHLIQELISHINNFEINSQTYQELKDFTNEQYELFRKLNWNICQGKQIFEFENHDYFQQNKETELLDSFIYQKEDEFIYFQNSINAINNLKPTNAWNYYHSIDYILKANFERNPELGYKLLESIIEIYPSKLNPPQKTINLISTYSEYWSKRLWDFLCSNPKPEINKWKLLFLEYLQPEFINDNYINEVLNTFSQLREHYYLNFMDFEKYQLIDNRIIEKIIKIIVNKDNPDLIISINPDSVEFCISCLTNNFKLLSEFYFKQMKINDTFDYKLVGLKKIIECNIDFLYDFTIFYFDDETNNRALNTNADFKFLWELNEFEPILESIILFISEKNIFLDKLNTPFILFFNNPDENIKFKIQTFLTKFIENNYSEPSKMNTIFDLIRCHCDYLFDNAFLKYLELNQNLNDFKRIHWLNRIESYSDNVIIWDRIKEKWERLLRIIVTANNRTALIPIKNYIIQMIKIQDQNSNFELKDRFINPNNY